MRESSKTSLTDLLFKSWILINKNTKFVIVFITIIALFLSISIIFINKNLSIAIDSTPDIDISKSINAYVEKDGNISIDKANILAKNINSYIYNIEVIDTEDNCKWYLNFDNSHNSYTLDSVNKNVDTNITLVKNQAQNIIITLDSEKDENLKRIGTNNVKFLFKIIEAKDKYEGPYSKVNGALSNTDSLNRSATLDNITYPINNNKEVGLFYFLWQGQHGTDGPYDNDKIYKENKESVLSEDNWIKNGGGSHGAHHFWGEPLYGYYTTNDSWIYRKHLQMFIDVGIDYLIFDTTNRVTYKDCFSKLLSVWYEYYIQGYNVPKLAFYTNSLSEKTMKDLYENIYHDSILQQQYPEIDNLWYKRNNKPLIIGKFEDNNNEYEEIAVSTLTPEI